MRNFTIALTILFLSACAARAPKPVLPKQISLVIGNPVGYGLHDVLLFPVGGNYNPNITEAEKKSDAGNGITSNETFFSKNTTSNKYDRNSSDEYINTREEDFDIRNLLFYNKKTGKTYPMTNDTLHILSFAIHSEFDKPLIFFRIVKKDINNDGKFNSKDAVMLFVSDLDGRQLVQVTPDNEQFFDYFYYPETKTILVKTAIDIDNDKAFTSKDETNFREMKLDNPSFGREIFTKGLKDSLKVLMKVQ